MDLNKYRLILASSSPSRKLLFEQVKVDFEVLVSGVDESVPDNFTPEETVKTLAQRKAKAVWQTLDETENVIVVAADSVVSIDDKILGKPKDKKHAFEMLKSLSGRTHRIFSGVCILTKDAQEVFANMTEVTFYKLTDEEISDYVETGEPMGKAGSYGIESKGVLLIKSICGDYSNIVGIPIAETLRKINKMVK